MKRRKEGFRIVPALAGLLAALTLPALAAAAPPPDDSQPLPTIAKVTSSSHVDPRMSAAASTLAGHGTTVRCLDATDWGTLAAEVGGGPFGGSYLSSGAWTTFATSRISMSPDLCGLVARFTYRSYFPVDGYAKTLLANAVATLAHEIENAAIGHSANDVAECRGLQIVASLAKLLRSSVKAATARTLATLAWTQRYPRMPDDYRSPDCHDGGPLDLHPTSSVWP